MKESRKFGSPELVIYIGPPAQTASYARLDPCVAPNPLVADVLDIEMLNVQAALDGAQSTATF